MAKKIIELIKDFLDDTPGVRCPILKNHREGLGPNGYGLSAPAVTALGTMQVNPILIEMVAELTGYSSADIGDLVQYLEDKRTEVFGGSLVEGPFAELAAAGMYNSDGVHIFEVSPDEIHTGVPVTLELRCNGFDHLPHQLPTARFVHAEADPLERFDQGVNNVTCDLDLNERATIQDVTFPHDGYWYILIQNPGDPEWHGDFRGNNRIKVLP